MATSRLLKRTMLRVSTLSRMYCCTSWLMAPARARTPSLAGALAAETPGAAPAGGRTRKVLADDAVVRALRLGLQVLLVELGLDERGNVLGAPVPLHSLRARGPGPHPSRGPAQGTPCRGPQPPPACRFAARSAPGRWTGGCRSRGSCGGRPGRPRPALARRARPWLAPTPAATPARPLGPRAARLGGCRLPAPASLGTLVRRAVWQPERPAPTGFEHAQKPVQRQRNRPFAWLNAAWAAGCRVFVQTVGAMDPSYSWAAYHHHQQHQQQQPQQAFPPQHPWGGPYGPQQHQQAQQHYQHQQHQQQQAGPWALQYQQHQGGWQAPYQAGPAQWAQPPQQAHPGQPALPLEAPPDQLPPPGAELQPALPPDQPPPLPQEPAQPPAPFQSSLPPPGLQLQQPVRPPAQPLYHQPPVHYPAPAQHQAAAAAAAAAPPHWQGHPPAALPAPVWASAQPVAPQVCAWPAGWPCPLLQPALELSLAPRGCWQPAADSLHHALGVGPATVRPCAVCLPCVRVGQGRVGRCEGPVGGSTGLDGVRGLVLPQCRPVPSAHVGCAMQAPPPQPAPPDNSISGAKLFLPPGRSSRARKLVVILRGLPGSGKSHAARLIKDLEVQHGEGPARIHSIDDYFVTVSLPLAQGRSARHGSAPGCFRALRPGSAGCHGLPHEHRRPGGPGGRGEGGKSGQCRAGGGERHAGGGRAQGQAPQGTRAGVPVRARAGGCRPFTLPRPDALAETLCLLPLTCWHGSCLACLRERAASRVHGCL